MDSGFKFMTGCCNSGDFVFFDDTRAAFGEFFVDVSDHICDFTLEELFRPQIILVNFVNHLQTLSFLFIHPRIELSYEVEEFLFSVLNPFTVDVSQIIELND